MPWVPRICIRQRVTYASDGDHFTRSHNEDCCRSRGWIRGRFNSSCLVLLGRPDSPAGLENSSPVSSAPTLRAWPGAPSADLDGGLFPTIFLSARGAPAAM